MNMEVDTGNGKDKNNLSTLLLLKQIIMSLSVFSYGFSLTLFSSIWYKYLAICYPADIATVSAALKCKV